MSLIVCLTFDIVNDMSHLIERQKNMVPVKFNTNGHFRRKSVDTCSSCICSCKLCQNREDIGRDVFSVTG